MISPVLLQLRPEYLRPSSANFQAASQFSPSASDTNVLGAFSAGVELGRRHCIKRSSAINPPASGHLPQPFSHLQSSIVPESVTISHGDSAFPLRRDNAVAHRYQPIHAVLFDSDSILVQHSRMLSMNFVRPGEISGALESATSRARSQLNSPKRIVS